MRTAESVFARVVVGVDGSAQGFEACRQAARLAPPGALLEAVAVVHLSDAVHAAFRAAEVADELGLAADRALDRAARILGETAETRFVNGFAVTALIREIEATGATLVALGSHGHRRSAEMLLGGVSGDMLHQAPCSVLIARRPAGETVERVFPRSIVVGVDGSPEAALALAAAAELVERLGARLRVVVAAGGKGVNLSEARAQAPGLDEVPGRPVPALVEAARAADLLVVGSRGLHGFAALGSVSERVAHEASCSVLVVRHAGAAGGAHLLRG
ncbi:MAG TPA: universal stress protein [Gaiellaceae bacterium]|nr:universal stress protein [Gaiellaceae bacterium]